MSRDYQQLQKRRRQRLSLAFFATAMVPVAIAIHLGSECVAIGAHELAASMFTRHLYLLISGVVALVGGVLLCGALAPVAERHRRLRLILTELPYRNNRLSFASLCFAIQALLFVGSQALEGYPIADGDVFGASLTALLLCVTAAFSLEALPERVVRILATQYRSRSSAYGLNRRVMLPRQSCRRVRIPLLKRYQAVVGNRPPPSAL